jgi:hypothetical protein
MITPGEEILLGAGQGSRSRSSSPITPSQAVVDVREGPCGCGWGRHNRSPAVCWSRALVAAEGEAEAVAVAEAAAEVGEVAAAVAAVAEVAEVAEVAGAAGAAGARAVEASAAERRRTSALRPTRSERSGRAGPQPRGPGAASRAGPRRGAERPGLPPPDGRLGLDQAPHRGGVLARREGGGSTRSQRRRWLRAAPLPPALSSSCHPLSRLIRHRVTCPFCRSSGEESPRYPFTKQLPSLVRVTRERVDIVAFDEDDESPFVGLLRVEAA